MDRQSFEKLVAEAMDALPARFKKLIRNVAVLVEDYPSLEVRRRMGAPSRSSILGLYHGTPFQHRGPYYGNLPPDVIIIYQRPIEEICATDADIREQVQDTVVHEVAHYFGFTDAELREIERQMAAARRGEPPDKED
jgi:predicted Zn-dependent protease with MMP-like domain